ncbi:hypothetical protein [Mesomycoplasma ovipneumoniae]|uniref:hypothetical protein n=1 Tax=Mesomycoplasma ovipneumoniae TaxID=29562 RepID=UPI003080AB6A
MKNFLDFKDLIPNCEPVWSSDWKSEKSCNLGNFWFPVHDFSIDSWGLKSYPYWNWFDKICFNSSAFWLSFSINFSNSALEINEVAVTIFSSWILGWVGEVVEVWTCWIWAELSGKELIK